MGRLLFHPQANQSLETTCVTKIIITWFLHSVSFAESDIPGEDIEAGLFQSNKAAPRTDAPIRQSLPSFALLSYVSDYFLTDRAIQLMRSMSFRVRLCLV